MGAATAFWGDSLTNSSAGSSSIMSAVGYTNDVYYNGGVAGNTSSDVLARFQAQLSRRHWNQVIWVGHNWNSEAQILSDIANMVAEINHSRYLIVSMLNNGNDAAGQGPSGARYLEIVSLASSLSALYGTRFYDLRADMVAYGVGIADANSVNFDAPPSTYQPTDVHLNTDGYTDAATRIRAKLDTLGWISEGVLRQQIGMAGGR
jgi:lysophospholipase L1-like esterase